MVASRAKGRHCLGRDVTEFSMVMMMFYILITVWIVQSSPNGEFNVYAFYHMKILSQNKNYKQILNFS